MRAALYAQVSTHDQLILAMQIDAMQELTTRRGWTVIDARADMGSRATATLRCKGCCMGTSGSCAHGLDIPTHHPHLRRLLTRRRVPQETVRVMGLPRGMVPAIGPPAEEKDHADP